MQEVVAQQHLEVGIEAEVGQGSGADVAGMVDVVGDELALLKRLHQHITGHQRPHLMATQASSATSKSTNRSHDQASELLCGLLCFPAPSTSIS